MNTSGRVTGEGREPGIGAYGFVWQQGTITKGKGELLPFLDRIKIGVLTAGIPVSSSVSPPTLLEEMTALSAPMRSATSGSSRPEARRLAIRTTAQASTTSLRWSATSGLGNPRQPPGRVHRLTE
jgi:hypothetical protein